MSGDAKEIKATMVAARERANRMSVKSNGKQKRLRKHEADESTLRPEDRQTGRKLEVDPVAIADLAKAMGITR